jgi:hypothetical protein
MLCRNLLSATALILVNLGDAAAQDAKPPPDIMPTTPPIYGPPATDLPPSPSRLAGFFSWGKGEDRASDYRSAAPSRDAPPKAIETVEPNFFDPRTGEPAIWYRKTKSGEIQLFDKSGFHPVTGERLAPATKEVADLWKAQLARRPPGPIDNPKQFDFFDPLTGVPKAWFRRTATGKYEFFDGPGYYRGSKAPLSVVSHDVIRGWQESFDKSFEKACYVITRDGEEPVRYGNEAGFNAISGRQCRELTPEIAGRVREYEKGRRPRPIDATEPTFFDPHTGEPIVWYFKSKTGDVEIFDLMGFHPETGDELLPISTDIVDLWKSQRSESDTPTAKITPQRTGSGRPSFLDPVLDPVTGRPRAWYRRDGTGDDVLDDNWAQRDPERIAPEARERDKEEARRCDQLAGNPSDPRRSGAGVPYNVLRMQARGAVEACTIASDANPDEHRFKYQLGRALEFLDRKKAFDIQADLVRLGYPAAYDNLGWMFFYDKKNISQAVTHFRMGVELGDPDSMVSLAGMINRGAFNPPNSTHLKTSLLKKAAGMGDQAALRAYSSELERQQDPQNRQLSEHRRMVETYGEVVRSMPWR